MQEKRDYLWIHILSPPPLQISELLCRGRKGFDYGFFSFFVPKESSDKKKKMWRTILNVLDACLMHVWNFGLLKYPTSELRQ